MLVTLYPSRPLVGIVYEWVSGTKPFNREGKAASIIPVHKKGRAGDLKWVGDITGMECVDESVCSLTKNTKQTCRNSDEGHKPRVGVREDAFLWWNPGAQPWQEDQRWRGSLRTAMDCNWRESGEEKVEQGSVPGSQIQQRKWTLGTKR